MSKKHKNEQLAAAQSTVQQLPHADNKWRWLLIAIPLIAALAVYSNSFSNTLLYGDDENIITRNMYLDDWRYLPDIFKGSLMSGSGSPCNFYRPLQTTLCAAITHIFGRGPVWPYHLANSVLHGLTGAMIAVLLYLLAPDIGIWPALAGALFWTLHPLHVEEVAQPTGTQSPMHGFFMMAAMVCLIIILRKRHNALKPVQKPATMPPCSTGRGWLLVMAGFMLVGWLASRTASSARSLTAQYAALAGYVAAEAIIFVPLLYVAEQYAPSMIRSAAAVTLVGFGGLTAVVFTTKKDFSFLGAFLRWAGIGALLMIGAGLVFGFQLGTYFSVGMIVLAGAAILYDTSNVMRSFPEDRYVAAALQLFASIALMFFRMEPAPNI